VIKMESGKLRRLGRIFRDDGKTVIVPMDHGVPAGPIEGLADIRKTMNHVAKGGADAVLVHAGVAKTVDTSPFGLILHLSGATRLANDPNWKTQLCSVKEAVRLGADAVSVHVNVGSEREQNMLETFSRILEECDDYSVPLLAMMYPRGPKIRDEHSYKVVSHAVRLGYELGADIVQTNYTGDVEGFRDVVNSVRIPIVVAGGPKANSASECLRTVYESIKAGARGVSIGRNVFQHQDPTIMTQAIAEMVHNDPIPGNPSPTLVEKSEAILGRASITTFPKLTFLG
jgi:fructose-bisphosphate aldolase / 2-amino-3,7-dideoxy-D-threo-hept-6-ulosonate synthase